MDSVGLEPTRRGSTTELQINTPNAGAALFASAVTASLARCHACGYLWFSVVFCLFLGNKEMNPSSTLLPAIVAPLVACNSRADDVLRFIVVL